MREAFRVYLMVGFIGSGKSTWAKNKVQSEPDLVIVNRDSLRVMIHGKYGYSQETEEIVKLLAEEAVALAAQRGFSVVIDETNLTKKKRAAWLELVQKVAINTDRELMLEVIHCSESEGNVAYRMQGDSRGLSVKKWVGVLKSMKEIYEPPKMTEFPEGAFFEVVRMNGGVE